jgi:hypothetical protein
MREVCERGQQGGQFGLGKRSSQSRPAQCVARPLVGLVVAAHPATELVFTMPSLVIRFAAGS